MCARRAKHRDELLGEELPHRSSVAFDHHRDLCQRGRGCPPSGGARAVEVDDLHDRDNDVPLERLS